MQQLNKLSLKQREELFRQLRISITHHSNAIEGTTLSFGETKELLELGHTAGHKPLGEQLVILGFAKAYVGEGEAKPLGLEVEIVPEVVKKFKAGDKLKVQLLFNGKPLKGEIKVRTSEKTISHWTDENGFAEIELEKGVNVISARHVDETATEKYDKRNITTTLTIITE